MEDKQTRVPEQVAGIATTVPGEKEEARGRSDKDDNELTERKRIHRLEKEKLKLTSTHNRQLSMLEAELARLRSSVERGEAQRAELQYQVTASRRDVQRVSQSNRELTEHAAALQKILDMTRQARQEEGLALREEADERDALIDGLTSDGQRLRRLLQCQEEALEEARERMTALREEVVQGRKSLEAEGTACQEAQEKARRAQQALQRLQTEYSQYKSELSVALESDKRNIADLTSMLEEEKRRHANTYLRLEQALKTELHYEKLLEEIRETLRQTTNQDAEDDEEQRRPADVIHLLHLTIARQGVAEQQVRDLMSECEKLEREKRSLGHVTTHQKRHLQEAHQLSLELQERMSRLEQESQDWFTQNRELREESEAQLSNLRRIYLRLSLDGTLTELQSPMSHSGLSEQIDELVERLTSDLRNTQNKVAGLQAECEEKNEHAKRLRRRLKVALARAREYMSKNSRFARIVTQLRDLLSRSRRKSAAFLWACSLLLEATAHTQWRLRALTEQKRLLARRLASREEPAEELRCLADALAVDRGGPPEGRDAGTVSRRWKKYVCVVAALRWWRAIGRRNAARFHLETGGRLACLKGPDGCEPGEGRDIWYVRQLWSKRLSSTILSCIANAPPPDASPSRVSSLARATLNRLLDQIAGPSGWPPEISPSTPPSDDFKAAASRLRHHFLLLSRRLHSAEMERQSLRLQVAQMGRPEDGGVDASGMVPVKHFHVVCANLRQALEGEEEARRLLEERSIQLEALQRRIDSYAAEQARAQRALRRVAEALAEARRRLRGKERSLLILAERLSRADKEKRRLEVRLRRFEDRRHVISQGKTREEVTVPPASCSWKTKPLLSGCKGSEGRLPGQGSPSQQKLFIESE
nr:coiled-coil domain-containing protein 171-like [Nerophis lumbriciformis]